MTREGISLYRCEFKCEKTGDKKHVKKWSIIFVKSFLRAKTASKSTIFDMRAEMGEKCGKNKGESIIFIITRRFFVKKENIKLKRKLILQAFLPLSLSVFIKNFDSAILSSLFNFLARLFSGEISVICEIVSHHNTWPFILLLISAICVISGCVAIWQFKSVHFSGFIDAGEKIKIEYELTDSGITFFMTFIIPLMIDEVSSINDFIVYIGVIWLVVMLMTKTNLYYQNPVLTLLGYKIYNVKFINPSRKECKNKNFIAVCKKEITEDKIIKWKYISDNICLMYNKH